MRILHLYHDLMNLYGEYGNIVVLKKHLEDQGIKVTVDKKTIGDKINFSNYDFVYCGSGSERNQDVALDDLLKRKKSFIKAIENDVLMLFTGNAMELLGNAIDDKECLGIIDFDTKKTNERFTGDVIVSNKEIGEVVGFVNKCTIVSEAKKHLFTYVFKDTNIKDKKTKDEDDNEKYEGYHVGNIYGTHIIGPILVKNPNFMKKIVTILAKKENKKFKYKDITYQFEEDSYNVTLNALKQRIK